MSSENHGTFVLFFREAFGRYGLVLLIFVLLTVFFGCGGDKEETPVPQENTSMVPEGTQDASPAETANGTNQDASQDPMNGTESTGSEDSGQDTSIADHASSQAPAQDSDPAPAPSRDLSSTGVVGIYSIQVGSFQKLAYAEKRSEDIWALGYEAVIEELDLSGVLYHRVLVRGIADRATAQEMGDTLKAKLGISYLIKRAE